MSVQAVEVHKLCGPEDAYLNVLSEEKLNYADAIGVSGVGGEAWPAFIHKGVLGIFTLVTFGSPEARDDYLASTPDVERIWLYGAPTEVNDAD